MKKSSPLKLVVDTNLWVSFIISDKLNLLDDLLIGGRVRLLFSNELLREIEATMGKPRLKKFFANNQLKEMIDAFDPYIEYIEVKSVVKVCRDPNDDFLLALALDGNANFLITGDQDLLVLGQYGKTKIRTIADFLSKIKF